MFSSRPRVGSTVAQIAGNSTIVDTPITPGGLDGIDKSLSREGIEADAPWSFAMYRVSWQWCGMESDA